MSLTFNLEAETPSQPEVKSQGFSPVYLSIAVALIALVAFGGFFTYESWQAQKAVEEQRRAIAELTRTHNFVVSVSHSGFNFCYIDPRDVSWKGSIASDTGSFSVEGCGSDSWTVNSRHVGVSFQNQWDEGTLGVSITKDGTNCLSQTTEASYGIVSGGC